MWPNRQDAELSALARPHPPVAPESPKLFSFLLDESGGRRGCGNDALLDEHVDEPREFFRELVEDLGQPFVTLPGERRIGALSERDVVVDVHQAASQAVTEKARDEE